jgi:hypothetical protein
MTIGIRGCAELTYGSVAVRRSSRQCYLNVTDWIFTVCSLDETVKHTLSGLRNLTADLNRRSGCKRIGRAGTLRLRKRSPRQKKLRDEKSHQSITAISPNGLTPKSP